MSATTDSTGNSSGRQYPAPNYTQTPNEFFDEVLPQITALSELKVTLAIMRQTFGWHRTEDQISLSRLQTLTGLSRQSVTEGVKLAMQRGYIGRRKQGQNYIYGLRVSSQDSRLATSQEFRPTKERVKESIGKASKEPLPANAENGVVPLGQYCIKTLADKITAARKNGRDLHSPTEGEKRSFAAMYKQCAKDGHTTEILNLALDYMIEKASGQLEDEARAWCGYRTALDRVLDGWRPIGVTTSDEKEAIEADLQRRREFALAYEEIMRNGGK